MRPYRVNLILPRSWSDQADQLDAGRHVVVIVNALSRRDVAPLLMDRGVAQHAAEAAGGSAQQVPVDGRTALDALAAAGVFNARMMDVLLWAGAQDQAAVYRAEAPLELGAANVITVATFRRASGVLSAQAADA